MYNILLLFICNWTCLFMFFFVFFGYAQPEDPEVIRFLLATEIIPLSLKIMERGRELSQAVATFILQKILLDDYGLNFICDPERGTRFQAVNSVLANVVNTLATAEKPSLRLLKHTIRCYLRFCDHPS